LGAVLGAELRSGQGWPQATAGGGAAAALSATSSAQQWRPHNVRGDAGIGQATSSHTRSVVHRKFDGRRHQRRQFQPAASIISNRWFLINFTPLVTPQRQIEQGGERRKCLDADIRLSCRKPGVRTCRPVEHPGRHFKPPICLRRFQRAAEDDKTILVDGTMNANSATKPRMMPIENLAKNGPVGVLKPRCTTACALTWR
jgi:hypothetical protein